MNIKTDLAILGMLAIGMAFGSVYYGYKVSTNAKDEIERAQKEVDEIQDRFTDAVKENERLAGIIASQNTAMDVANKKAEEAEGKNEGRKDSIDKAPSNWSDCTLPECVRDAFGTNTIRSDYHKTPVDTNGAVQATGTDETGNK